MIDKELLAELQWLAVVMHDLDKRVAHGKGTQTVAALREEYFARYQEIRRVRPAAAASNGAAQPAAQPAWPRPSERITPSVGTKMAGAAGTSIFATRPMPAQPAPAQPAAQAGAASVPPPAPAPAGPVFSWQAFVSEQAIAIMAYLGGFLALVATLTFVVSKSATLPTPTLLVVIGVYVGFGILGWSMRHSERLRTVGRVYLGVFALMTPLVALALYRFELQSLNVPVAGMLCISAVYAAIVYLGLAVQTRFSTYAYLGWAALIVAAIAYIPWTHSNWQWWVFILGLVTLALLVPRRIKLPAFAMLGEPATQVAALTTIPTVIGVQALGIIGAIQTLVYGAFPTIQVQPAPLALGACILVPITAGWRLTVPRWLPRQQQVIIDTIDGFNAFFFAEAVGGVTIWQANVPLELVFRPLAVSLSITALFEFGPGLALYRWQQNRAWLRRFLECFAIAMCAASAMMTAMYPFPNVALALALGAGLLVSVGAALIDGRWWLLVSGVFLTLDYSTLLKNTLPAQVVTDNQATFSFVLTMALWLAALALGTRAQTRRLAAPVYVVAFGNALLTLLMLSNQPIGYQVVLLLIFTTTAFIAGLREQQPIIGNLTTVFFGGYTSFVLSNNSFSLLNSSHDALPISALAVGFAVAALAIRSRWGWVWALALSITTLWTVLLTAGYVTFDIAHSPDWTASGLPYISWFLLLFVVITGGIALWEKQPAIMVIPALLAFWALGLATSDVSSAALDFGLLAAGAALRYWRGRWWGTALEAAAVPGSIIVVIRLNNLGDGAAYWQVAFLLAFGVAAYLIALQERVPALTAVSALYALAAAVFLPGPDNFVPTLVLTFALAGVGAAQRLPQFSGRLRRAYALALYAAAVGCSVITTVRIVPLDAAHVEAQLLVFAAVSYILVVIEGVPLAAGIPVLYALASVLVQSNPHALLPLAVIFALLGLLAGRIASAAWSWPAYASAVFAALMTLVLGAPVPGFEAGALFVLAVLALIICVVESRPEVLFAALLLGVLALGAEVNSLSLSRAFGTLAFLALAWLYVLAAPLWSAVPWLRQRGGAWWVGVAAGTARQPPPREAARSRDFGLLGVWILRVAGYLVAAGTTLIAVFTPDSFAKDASATLAVVFALLSLAGMLLHLSRLLHYSPGRYLAGLSAALAITWMARWLGADNPQAYIAAPGSYLLIVGAFLPADRQIRHARRIGQFASLAGALLLMLPTLYQSFTVPDPQFQLVYGLVLLFESVLIIGLGVGLHSRTLIYVGSGFIGVDVLSGVGLALRSGVSPAIVLALLAALLIGTATWLSLRPRHDTKSAGD